MSTPLPSRLHRWLTRESRKWVQNHWITEEQRQKILSAYSLHKPRLRAAWALFLLASLFLLFGAYHLALALLPGLPAVTVFLLLYLAYLSAFGILLRARHALWRRLAAWSTGLLWGSLLAMVWYRSSWVIPEDIFFLTWALHFALLGLLLPAPEQWLSVYLLVAFPLLLVPEQPLLLPGGWTLLLLWALFSVSLALQWQLRDGWSGLPWIFGWSAFAVYLLAGHWNLPWPPTLVPSVFWRLLILLLAAFGLLLGSSARGQLFLWWAAIALLAVLREGVAHLPAQAEGFWVRMLQFLVPLLWSLWAFVYGMALSVRTLVVLGILGIVAITMVGFPMAFGATLAQAAAWLVFGVLFLLGAWFLQWRTRES